MRKGLIIFLLFFLILPLSANCDSWTAEDTVRQTIFTAITCVDWLQTKEIADNPRFYETNKILGRDPSQGKINRYFILALTGHVLASWLMPSKMNIKGYIIHPRAIWQYLSIGVESGFVCHNYNIGVSLHW